MISTGFLVLLVSFLSFVFTHSMRSCVPESFNAKAGRFGTGTCDVLNLRNNRTYTLEITPTPIPTVICDPFVSKHFLNCPVFPNNIPPPSWQDCCSPSDATYGFCCIDPVRYGVSTGKRDEDMPTPLRIGGRSCATVGK